MILVITGPTGVGKTKLSIALAHKYKAIIINGDSMQVYKGLNIGTAKIKEEEKEGIKHYLFDVVNPEDMYTVYDYQKDVRKIISEHPKDNIIIVGGTGLYIKAALFNYEFSNQTNYNLYENKTNEELLSLVKEKNPNLNIHINNRKRLIRALNKEEDYSQKGNEEVIPAIFIGLTTDREKLYNIINKRVDKMLDDGLVSEVKAFYDQGIKSKALETGIGYKELYAYFNHQISLEEAKVLIKANSRHYAKRQYTFFKHQLPVKWFDVNFDHFDETIK